MLQSQYQYQRTASAGTSLKPPGQTHLDPARIVRLAELPTEVVDGEHEHILVAGGRPGHREPEQPEQPEQCVDLRLDLRPHHVHMHFCSYVLTRSQLLQKSN